MGRKINKSKNEMIWSSRSYLQQVPGAAIGVGEGRKGRSLRAQSRSLPPCAHPGAQHLQAVATYPGVLLSGQGSLLGKF